MEASNNTDMAWSEADSRHFIERGRIHTPARDEIRETMLDLIPAEHDEPFLAVELGVGAGWLSAAILERFPAARVLGLDGSPTMLRETEARLQPFAGRFELRPFRLEDRPGSRRFGQECALLRQLAGDPPPRCGRQAGALPRPIRASSVGGALLIADLVAPRSERERRYMARWWDAEVERQSLALTGSRDAYQEFVDDHLNWYDLSRPHGYALDGAGAP